MAHIAVIAQDFDIFDGHPHARTGAISLKHLRDAGAAGVILGHSEVADSPRIVTEKLKAAISEGFEHLVVLWGESWEEHESGPVESLVAQRFREILQGIDEAHMILGYEPSWGTWGSGKEGVAPPQPAQISACIKTLKRQHPSHQFIYGGRSDPARAGAIMEDPDVAGLILGSACSSVHKTLAIANRMKDVPQRKILVCNFKAYDIEDPYEDYVREIAKLPDDFLVLLAPPYTQIHRVSSML